MGLEIENTPCSVKRVDSDQKRRPKAVTKAENKINFDSLSKDVDHLSTHGDMLRRRSWTYRRQ